MRGGRLTRSWYMFRYWLARHLLQLGLRTLPPGRVRCELYALVDQWATRVGLAVRRQAPKRPAGQRTHE